MIMKKNRIQLGVILIASFTLYSCGNTASKQKELELREREIAIKEKELGIQPAQKTDSTVKKTAMAASEVKATELKVDLIPEGGAQGQVTFLVKGKTAFYYEERITDKGVEYGKGKISINGTAYTLKKLSFNKKDASFIITGDQITIKTSACRILQTESEDCTYGSYKTITITLNGATTVLKNVDLQDCPSFN